MEETKWYNEQKKQKTVVKRKATVSGHRLRRGGV